MSEQTGTLGKFAVVFEPRPDGGLRVHSDDIPGFVLSHPDSDLAMSDVIPALEVIISEMEGRKVRVELLPQLKRDRSLLDTVPREREQREYIASRDKS